ncbi:MAG: hypothetical protein HOZ81_50235 [Streptomyces sp.]|nr:hypothetical protein [Streptomyces sp.]
MTAGATVAAVSPPATPEHAWRSAAALLEGDLRRRRNRLPGYRGLTSAVRAVLAGAAAVGVLTVGALLWGIGAVFGRVFPVGANGAEPVAAACWLGAAVVFVGQVAAARPVQARLLLDPPDRGVLLSWGVPPTAVFGARLLAPGLASAAGTTLVVAVFATPWLTATATGRALLPAVLVTVVGAACAGAAAHICAMAVLMNTARDRSTGRWVLYAVVLGLAAGFFLSPYAGRFAGAASYEDITLSLRGSVAGMRPGLWDELFAPGHLPHGLLAWALVTALLTLAARLLLRSAAHRSTLVPTAATRDAEPRRVSSRRIGLVVKDLLALRRKPAAVTAPFHRLCAAAVGVAALGVGVRLRFGGDVPWAVPVHTWGPAVALALFLAVSTVVAQVSGVEAEGRGLEALRQAPLPFGAVLVAKVWACVCAAALPVVPAYLGVLLAAGGAVTPAAVLALPLALVGGSVAMVVTAFVVPEAETFSEDRIVRSGAAETVEGVVAAALVAPGSAGPLLRRLLDLPGGAAAQALDAGCALITLSLFTAGLRLLARRDIRFRKAIL